MAYERTNGQHQAGVLYRYLRLDARFPITRVAQLSGIADSSLEDWVLNRSPLPAWALPKLLVAFEAIDAGAGLVFLREALKLAGVADLHGAPRISATPTDDARRVQDAAAAFVTELVACLIDPRTPGVLDERELRELEPETRELLRATSGFDASARAVECQQSLI